LGNRETPTILSILVIEDLARAFYLPVLSALAIGAGVLAGATALVVALLVVAVILYLALRHGRVVSRLFAANHSESLVLGVLRLTMLVAGIPPVPVSNRASPAESGFHGREPTHAPAIHVDIAEEHLARPHPETELPVERAVDDERLLGLRVRCLPDDLVQVALVVAIGSGGDRG